MGVEGDGRRGGTGVRWDGRLREMGAGEIGIRGDGRDRGMVVPWDGQGMSGIRCC